MARCSLHQFMLAWSLSQKFGAVENILKNSWVLDKRQVGKEIKIYFYASSQNLNTYHNLKPVQKGWRISKAPIFSVGWIIFGYISISSCAQENLLNATVEGITQILHWIHHHPTIYDITCEQCTHITSC